MTSSRTETVSALASRSIICAKCGFPTRLSPEIPCWTCWLVDAQKRMLGLALSGPAWRGRWTEDKERSRPPARHVARKAARYRRAPPAAQPKREKAVSRRKGKGAKRARSVRVSLAAPEPRAEPAGAPPPVESAR